MIRLRRNDLQPNEVLDLQLSPDPAAIITRTIIAAGRCRDTTDSVDIILDSPKTVDITVVGDGGRDTAAEEIEAWYYFWLGFNPVTGEIQARMSLSASAPTFPAGFSFIRCVGERRNNATLNLLNMITCGSGRDRVIQYLEDHETVLAVIVGGSATAYTIVDASDLVPPPVEKAFFVFRSFAVASFARPEGFTGDFITLVSNRSLAQEMLVNSSQEFEYKVQTAAGNFDAIVTGYRRIL